MNISSVLNAFRVGSSIDNPTPFKWASMAIVISLIVLQVLQHFGVMVEVSADDWVQLVSFVLVLLSQVLTTDKIGLLPPSDPKTED